MPGTRPCVNMAACARQYICLRSNSLTVHVATSSALGATALEQSYVRLCLYYNIHCIYRGLSLRGMTACSNVFLLEVMVASFKRSQSIDAHISRQNMKYRHLNTSTIVRRNDSQIIGCPVRWVNNCCNQAFLF